MRNLLLLFWSVLMLVALAFGCSSKDDVLPYIDILSADGENLSNGSIVYDSQGGVRDIQIESNSEWNIECSADWIAFSQKYGSGNANVRMSVGAADKSRSAVVIVRVEGASIYRTFDVIQYVEDIPTEPDEPEQPEEPNEPTEPETPGEQPEEPNEPTEPETPGEQPEEPNGPTEPETPGEQPEGPSDPTEPEQPEQPFEPSEPTEPEEPTPPQPELFDIVSSMDLLSEGVYYIGGYPDNGILYLATGGLTSVNHCNTVQFSYEDGELKPIAAATPVEVRLEKATQQNGYYLYFAGDGYLTAMGVGAGKLSFVAEKEAYWKFSEHDDGGFELRHSEFKVKLIVSQKATENVLRSIADYEDGCAVILFKRRNN